MCFRRWTRSAALVSFRAADTGLETTRGVTLRQLELQPLDLLTIVPDHAEQARSELDDRVVRYLRAHANPRPDGPVTIQYLTAGSVPVSVFEALVPMHVPGDIRNIQLRRAAMPRVDETPVHPRTWLMRQGLDDGQPAGYHLHEEEVPRAGDRATRAYQRTRWRDGRVWVWLGARKQTGRGEASSGLAFDRIVDLSRP